MFGSSRGDETNLSDSRAAATEGSIASTTTGKKNTTTVKAGEIVADFSGIGSQSQVVKNRGGFGLGTGGGSGGDMQTGNIDVNSTIITNDPTTALRAIEATKNIAEKGMENLLTNTQFSISTNTALTNDALERSAKAGESQQKFVESVVADSVQAVKDLALPANERGFNSTLYIVGALVGVFIYFRYKSPKK